MSEAGCAVRCLAPAAFAATLDGIDREDARAVQFVCATGQRFQALLIGQGVARRLLVAERGLATESEARALASLSCASLCACDIATLLGQAQNGVEETLRSLAARGLVAETSVEGMPFFSLRERGRRVLDSVLGRGS